MDKTVLFDFPNIFNPNREDPYMYSAYGKELYEKGYDIENIMTNGLNINNLPDVLISYKPRTYPIAFLEEMSDQGTKMIYIYPDARKEQPHGVVDVAMYFDYFLAVCNLNDYKKLLPETKVVYFKQAVDPTLYQWVSPFSIGFTRRNWTFIGSYYEGREDLMKALEINRDSGKVWGNEWQKCPFKIPWSGHEIYNTHYSMVLNRSKVAVNWSYLNTHRGAWSTRVYKTLASGVPMVSDNTIGMKQLFKDGVHCFYFEDSDDLSTMINDPVGQFGEEVLEEVAFNGRNLILSKHTYEHRAKELVEICDL